MRRGPKCPELTITLPADAEPLQEYHAWEPRPGLETEYRHDRVINYWSWGCEEAMPMLGGDGECGYSIRYGFPITNEQWLFGHCLGSTFEPYYQLLIGRDYGKRVLPVFMRRWPHTTRALYQSPAAGPSLVRVQGPTPAWLVGVLYEDAGDSERFEFPPDQQKRLWRAVLDVFFELLEAEDMNISLAPIVAGDKYWQRQLQLALSAAQLFGNVLDANSVLDLIGDLIDPNS